MTASLSDFQQRPALSHVLVVKAYEQAGKLKKIAIKTLALYNKSLRNKHDAAHYYLKGALRNSVKSSFPDDDQVLCVFQIA